MLLLVLVLAAPSCKSLRYDSASRLNDISVGMPKDEALAMLGTPESTHASDGAEILIYKWMKDPDSWGPIYYYVKFINGKVSSYGEARELQQQTAD